MLLEKGARVVAVEKDERLAEELRVKFEKDVSLGKLEILNADILNYELRIKNYALVGNIPYYITGALFKKFLENPPGGMQPKSITFVVQKEVADRIIKIKESILSISIKAYGEPEYGGVIKAGSFYPKPKVDSAIISVRNIGIEKFKDLSIERFFEVVKAGFSHKRKLLIKNLAEVSKVAFDTSGMIEIFKKCGISEKARAEDLKVDDWFSLTRELA